MGAAEPAAPSFRGEHVPSFRPSVLLVALSVWPTVTLATSERLDECTATDAPSEYLTTCSVDGNDACWYDSGSDTLKCNIGDFGDVKTSEAYAVNFGSNHTSRVSVFGTVDIVDGKLSTFCCVLDGADYHQPIQNIVLTGTDQDDTMGMRYGTSNLEGDNRTATLQGGAGADKLYGSNEDSSTFFETLSGGAGIDILYGGDGADKLFGDGGKDVLYGEDGDDELWGGSQNDVLYGGADDDLLRGQSGWDTLDGQGGTDKLWGGAGNDTLTSREGDVALGGDHDDTITCVGGDCVGGDGDDSIYAESANESVRLHGGPGSDSLFGSRFYPSVIYGGVGYDRLVGGLDEDVLCENGRLTESTFFPAPASSGAPHQYIEGGDFDDVLDFRDAGYDHEVWGNDTIETFTTDVAPAFMWADLTEFGVWYTQGPENAECALLRAEHGAW